MMIRINHRRLLRSRILRIAAVILVIWTWLEALSIHRTILSSETQRSSTYQNSEKIFLASLPWNNEIIFRTYLTKQIIDLVKALGVHNVYLSFYENGSYDGTKDALRELKMQLDDIGAPNVLAINETSHEDIIKHKPSVPTKDWIRIERRNFDMDGVKTGDYALRRIPYLSELRNTVLKPLEELAAKGQRFDKIMFLTDVVFSTNDMLDLLQTNGGEYAAACSLDFQSPPDFYDTFALRDSDGNPALMKTWPYFRSAASRDAVIAHEPVPVQSCWNGIVVMPAAPFYDPKSPLRFRGIPDSLAQHHVEGSECCLIHADNPLTQQLGVWINPRSRVGYCHAGLGKRKFALDWELMKWVCGTAYEQVHPSHKAWVSSLQIAWGLWENRLRRLATLGWTPDGKAKRRWEKWRRQSEEHLEPGGMCLIDEMQVVETHGWLHV